MATIKAFRAIRPNKGLEESVAALPYDVYNKKEAREAVREKPLSFLRIDRAETFFEEDQDMYASEVYERARDELQNGLQKGVFERDEQPGIYLYELTMNGRSQTGIVACASIDDYVTGIIKKHENTREEKEQDRIRHIDVSGMQTGPIFLAYRRNEEISRIVDQIKETAPLFDFESEDQIRHRGWGVFDPELVEKLIKGFGEVPNLYIADGHHRAASAVKVGLKRRERYPEYSGEEEFNYFLSVIFPDDELFIMDYNRVVKDLNGLAKEEFLEQMAREYEITELTQATYPKEKGEVTMVLDGKWYLCRQKDAVQSSDPVENLDVSVLQRKVLTPILGIKDPRTDARIDFVGGIRGLSELERRVREDAAVAFAMFPTTIGELFAVADAGLLMPPKSTWFEPKLRSGLFLHEIGQ